MVSAKWKDGMIRRTFDSLSRVLTEQQGNHEIRYEYDSGGNVIALIYPDGEKVIRKYDTQNRVTSIENKDGEPIARFIYAANDRIVKMFLGNQIETEFSSNRQGRLESIKYKRTGDHKLIDGFKYEYDDTGRMTHEIQLSEGTAYGERYYYDTANRPIKAGPRVQDVFDPNSPFEQVTTYEYFLKVHGNDELIMIGKVKL